MMQKPPRPTGITILAILGFIDGIIFIGLGGLIVGVSNSTILASYGYGAYSGAFAVIGGLAIIIGLFALVVGWGMITGKGWAWILALILYSLGGLVGLLFLVGGSATGFVIVLIEAILIWYMFRPGVKAYFGRGSAMMQQTGPTTST
jgi:hypothetical protein